MLLGLNLVGVVLGWVTVEALGVGKVGAHLGGAVLAHLLLRLLLLLLLLVGGVALGWER